MSSARRSGPQMTRLKGVRNPPPIRRRPAPSARLCPNPLCVNPKIEDVEDKRICMSCHSVVSDSTIVSELQFGETSAGAAVVQGSYVGADQTHTRSIGTSFRGVGGMGSREVTEANGKRYINQLAAALHIPPATADMAFQVYKLAMCHNFIQGRRTKNVAAVALYIACRKQKRNSTMLIDFSDVLNVNVFKLGQTFKDFCKECEISGFEPVLPENLVYRFATKLEFGRMTEQVAQDAVRLVQRMDRDWMTTGRRPSGICGACLILAARMNNFRRTVREVVYIVKVTDITINKRLEEFKFTESSNLTVEQFRIINLEKSTDPPSFYEQQNGKRKRKRTRQGEAESNSEENLNATPGPERDGSTAPNDGRQTQEPEVRRDKDGFAIPDIPIDPALLIDSVNASSSRAMTPPPTAPTSQDTPTRGNPGRSGRARSVRPEPPPLSSEDIALEQALETEITSFLSDPSTQEHAEAYARTLMAATALAAAQRGPSNVSMEEQISESEFADDPEVSSCVLSPEEQEIKERIWVHENRDYLRDQQRKMLKKQMEEKNGTKKAVRKRKRKGRIGEGGDGSVAGSPAEATVDMLRRRGFSKKINYGVIERMFDGSSRRASREASLAASETASDATTTAPAGGKPSPRRASAGAGAGSPPARKTRFAAAAARGPAPSIITTTTAPVTINIPDDPAPEEEEQADEDTGDDGNDDEEDDGAAITDVDMDDVGEPEDDFVDEAIDELVEESVEDAYGE